MNRKKSLSFLLLGLGIGIILTNLIYYVNPKIEYQNLSDEEIVEKAKELGMVFLKDSIQIDNIKEETSHIEEDYTDESKEEQVEEEQTEVEFKILQGQSLETIAENLYSAGLIDDVYGFVNYCKEKGMTRRFRVGTYNLVSGMDYEALLTTLIKKDS